MATVTPEGLLGMMSFLGRRVFMKRFNLFIWKQQQLEGSLSQNLVTLTRFDSLSYGWCLGKQSSNCLGNVKSGWVGKEHISQLIEFPM